MNELTSLSILSLFQTTKEQRQSFANDVISRLIEGEADPLQVHLQVKCTEDIIKQITSSDAYRKAIVEESEKRGEKSFQFHNAKFEIKETGVKYDWSKCEDPELVELLDKQEKLDKEVKARQDFLKTIPAKGMVIVADGGEPVTIYPPAKSSTTNVAVTLK